MKKLVSSAIMKLEYSFSTNLESETVEELDSGVGKEPRTYLHEKIERHSGKVIKSEGQCFWILFKSITTAALTAIEIQKDLGEQKKILIRTAISFGDILHENGDIYGDAVNLVSSICLITPFGENYFSKAAALVANSAEVKINFLGEIDLNDLNHKENIYSFHNASETLVIKNEGIINTYLVDCDEIMMASFDDIKSFLKEHESNASSFCKTYGGTLHTTIFSNNIITFKDSYSALSGIRVWVNRWTKFLRERNLDNHIYIGVGKGGFRKFRSTVYGFSKMVDTSIARSLKPDQSAIVVTKEIFDEVKETDLASSLNEFDPFTLGESEDEKELSRKQSFNSGLIEGEKVYEFKV
jgi:hypothetical protein